MLYIPHSAFYLYIGVCAKPVGVIVFDQYSDVQ